MRLDRTVRRAPLSALVALSSALFSLVLFSQPGPADAADPTYTAIVTSPDQDSDATWTSDNSTIAFDTDRNGSVNWDLYCAPASGGAETQLTFDAATDWGPVYSPDDSKILFYSTRSGNWDIWVLDLSDTSYTQLTTDPASDQDPDWYGGNVIVWKSLRSGNWDVWKMDADGGNKAQLTTDPGQDVYMAISPDESTVAFGSDRSGNFDIWLQPIGGGAAVQFTDDAELDNNPTWSPDGAILAFESLRGNGTDTDIWVKRLCGGNAFPLTGNILQRDEYPRWSHAMDKIAFTSNPNGSDDIWLIEGLAFGLAAGAVRDLISGDSIPGASVFIKPGKETVLADSAGLYEVFALADTITLIASAAGYAPDTSIVIIPADATLALDIELAPLSASTVEDPALDPDAPGAIFMAPPRARPNPSRGGARIHFALGRAARLDASIVDPAGRMVARLSEAKRFAAGEHSLEWDGRTAAGKRAPPGVYLYRVRADGREAGGRLNVVR